MIRALEQRLPSGLQRLDDHEIVFRGGAAGRAVCAICALMFAGSAAFLLWMTGIHSHQLARVWVYLAASGYGAMALGMWYAAGAREMAFDLRRGTYRQTTGFLCIPRSRHGKWDEIAGLYVKNTAQRNRNAPPRYWVCLAWNQPRRQDIVLLCHPDADVADRIMRRTADALGLPAGVEVFRRLWFRNPRLRRTDGRWLVFHKPPAVRLAWGISGKAIAIASLILSGGIVVTSGGLHFHSGSTNLGIILMDILGLLCLRAAGPEDLEVDLESRTYRCRYGFPYIARERKGPLDDIIALRTDGQGASGAKRVRLVWKQTTRGDMTLGEFRSLEEADAHLRGVAACLGLLLD